MTRRVIDGVEVEFGSGDVFADLELPRAEKLMIKSGLVVEIVRAVRELGLAPGGGRDPRGGIPRPKVSAA